MMPAARLRLYAPEGEARPDVAASQFVTEFRMGGRQFRVTQTIRAWTSQEWRALSELDRPSQAVRMANGVRVLLS